MSNISNFFKGDTRKKNRKIFAGAQSVTWTAPSNTTEIDVHVWGGGGYGGGGSPAGPMRQGGGGGGYTSNTFAVIGGSTVAVSVGATAGTSTATITNPNGPSTLTSTGGVPGAPGAPAPTRGTGGSGGHSLHPAEPTAYVLTANGGRSYLALPPSAPTPAQDGSYGTGGGGAGFIYGKGGDGGRVPSVIYPNPALNFPPTPSNKSVQSGSGGGGIRGDGGFGLSYDPPFNGGSGGGGGGFMPGGVAGDQTQLGQIAFGGAGLDGQQMSNSSDDTMLSSSNWFYLEDIQGHGGSSGASWIMNNVNNPGAYPQVQYARPGLSGGGGGGAPSEDRNNKINSRVGGGDGGIFAGGGGSKYTWGGKGGYGGGGGGGKYPDGRSPTDFSGSGGEGIIIIYY